MPFDNYVVGAIGRELNHVLTGGRVERVYQPEREEVILCVNRPPSGGRPPGRYNLLISANAGRPLIYLTEHREAGPQNPPAFCMLLRKYLIGARILNIAAVPRERILRFDFLTSSELGLNEERTLVFELMGKHSNLMLLNGDRIVDSIKRVSGDMSRVRQTLPGMTYLPPPPGKGVSPVMADEVKDADLTGKNLEYYDMRAEKGEYSPTIWFDGEKAADFHVFPLNRYFGMKKQTFTGETAVSEMLEAWYERREAQGRLSAKRNELEGALKARTEKLYLKKQRLSEELAEAEQAESLRETGDLITANIWRIEKGAKRVALEDYTRDGAVRTVDLDPKLTASQNAQRFYKLYNKAKTAAVIKAKQLEETQELLDYLEGAAHFLDEAGSAQSIDEMRVELTESGVLKQRGVKKGSRPGKGKTDRRIFSPVEYKLESGAQVLVGRNNTENDELTMRTAAKTDIWLHTKDIPGSHVILKPADTDSYEADLRTAAEIAAWHSKARSSEGVPVDYTQVKYVKKPSGAKPGYVIFTNNHTVYVTPKLPK